MDWVESEAGAVALAARVEDLRLPFAEALAVALPSLIGLVLALGLD